MRYAMKNTQSFKHWKKTVIASAFTALVVGAYSVNPPTVTAIEPLNQQAQSSSRLGPPSFSTLVKQVKPAVVNIAITGKVAGKASLAFPSVPQHSPFYKFFRQFQPSELSGPNNRQRDFQAVGSGFFISDDGYVVTNNHVIENADNIFVITQDGEKRKATLKGRDPKTDLALLKVEGSEAFPYVELGNSEKTEVGEWVIAVGNPFGLGGTVTAGIVSARGRDIQAGPYDDYIQVDAPINRGNSGGPLFDNKGQVIGINTAIYSPTGGNVGIAFAIPANLAKNVVSQLKEKGSVERGWLGVQIQSISELAAQSLGIDKEQGVLVSDVVANSPAEEAGVHIGDIILRIDGRSLNRPKDLSKLVAQTQSGNTSVLNIMRKGELHTFNVTISAHPNNEVRLAKASSQPQKSTGKLGVYLSDLTPRARKHFAIERNKRGVLVTDIEPNSPAAKAGIRSGDIISMVNQERVDSPSGVIARVKQAVEENKSSVLVLVEKHGRKRFISVELAPV